MKYSYCQLPESMLGTFGDISKNFGFSWKEFVMNVPSPMFLVTSYKSNGMPNACMQSWATFASAGQGNGFYAILASVYKGGHLYKTLSERGDAVINFMNASLYDACMATIRNNGFDTDEIASSGLTGEKAEWVNAPMVRECFMNLECRYAWEREIVPGDDHALICLEVIGAHIDENYLDDKTGDTGLLYNIHHPVNPESDKKTAHDYVGVLHKAIDAGEY